jgi:hypothetical protein
LIVDTYLPGRLFNKVREADRRERPFAPVFVGCWRFFEPTISGIELRLKSYFGVIIKAGKTKKVGQNERKVKKEKQGIGFCH